MVQLSLLDAGHQRLQVELFRHRAEFLRLLLFLIRRTEEPQSSRVRFGRQESGSQEGHAKGQRPPYPGMAGLLSDISRLISERWDQSAGESSARPDIADKAFPGLHLASLIAGNTIFETHPCASIQEGRCGRHTMQFWPCAFHKRTLQATPPNQNPMPTWEEEPGPALRALEGPRAAQVEDRQTAQEFPQDLPRPRRQSRSLRLPPPDPLASPTER